MGLARPHETDAMQKDPSCAHVEHVKCHDYTVSSQDLDDLPKDVPPSRMVWSWTSVADDEPALGCFRCLIPDLGLSCPTWGGGPEALLSQRPETHRPEKRRSNGDLGQSKL